MDVTNTVLGYKGNVGEWYTSAAVRCGLPAPCETAVEEGFNRAYSEMCEEHPCFGGFNMASKDWWHQTVRRSFDYAGYHYKDEPFECAFQRVYQRFGEPGMYTAFDDVIPFLQWARRHGVKVGVITNADERYVDSILPMLGFSKHLDFMVASKDIAIEKPDRGIFVEALRRAGSGQQPPFYRCLHVGDSYSRDYVGARNIGMHAVLMDRFDSPKTRAREAEGVAVARDFMDVVEMCIRDGLV